MLSFDNEIFFEREGHFLLFTKSVFKWVALLLEILEVVLRLAKTLTKHCDLLLVINLVRFILVAALGEFFDLYLVVFIIKNLPLSIREPDPQGLDLQR